MRKHGSEQRSEWEGHGSPDGVESGESRIPPKSASRKRLRFLHDDGTMDEWPDRSGQAGSSVVYLGDWKKEKSSRKIELRQRRDPDTASAETEPAGTSPHRRRSASPIWFVEKLLKTWRLNHDDAVFLLGFEPSDLPYVTDVLAGRAVLRGRDAKDRIAYLLWIRKTLSALHRSEEAENEWLREPQKILDDKAPMNLLLEGSMENLLLVKEYVEATAGW